MTKAQPHESGGRHAVSEWKAQSDLTPGISLAPERMTRPKLRSATKSAAEVGVVTSVSFSSAALCGSERQQLRQWNRLRAQHGAPVPPEESPELKRVRNSGWRSHGGPILDAGLDGSRQGFGVEVSKGKRGL